MPADKGKIIIADDVRINRDLLKNIFRDRYEILEAATDRETITLLEENADVCLVLLSLLMPLQNGMRVLEYMADRGLTATIPVILITGPSTPKAELQAYEYGVAEVIHKPFAPFVTLRRAENAIELYRQRNHMAQELERKNHELLESKERIIRNNNFLIMALGSVVEFRSVESGQHVQRVSHYTEVIL